MRGEAVLLTAAALLVLVCFWMLLRRGFDEAGDTREAYQSAMRPCAVYYTKDRVTCDKYDAGQLTPADLTGAAFKKMAAELKKTTTDGTTCKLSFGGWVEPGTTPVKVVGDTAGLAKGAYCYQPVAADGAGPDAISQPAFAVDPNDKVSDLGDGKTYARLTFKDYTYASMTAGYCASPFASLLPAGAPPTPAYLLAIETDATNKIMSYHAFVQGATGRTERLPDPYPQLAHLFTVQSNRNGLWLLPTPRQGQVYRMRMDACGAPVAFAGQTPVTAMLDIGQAGAPVAQLLEPTGGADFSGGTAGLQERIQTATASLESLHARITQLEAEAAAITGAATVDPAAMAPGAVLTKRTIPRCNTLQNGNDVQAIVGAGTPVGAPTILQDPNITYTGEDMRVYTVDGYLQIPQADDWNFLIRADDTGEFRVKGRLASSHYGRHAIDGMLENSTNIGLFPLPAGFVPFQARFVECTGAEGMLLSWMTWDKAKKQWRPPAQIPASAFFYHKGLFDNANERSRLEEEAKQLQAKITAMTSAVGIFTQSPGGSVQASLASTVGKAPPAALAPTLRSYDGRYYIAFNGFVPMGAEVAVGTPTDLQVLQLPEWNIVAAPKQVVPPPALLADGALAYTLSLWIKVEKAAAAARNVLLFGRDAADKTPALYVAEKSQAILRFRHMTGAAAEDGVDVAGLPWNQWSHFAFVVTPDRVLVYMNGALKANKPLPSGQSFGWNGDPLPKLFHLNHQGASAAQAADGGIFVRKVYWVNRAVPETAATGLSVKALALGL